MSSKIGIRGALNSSQRIRRCGACHYYLRTTSLLQTQTFLIINLTQPLATHKPTTQRFYCFRFTAFTHEGLFLSPPPTPVVTSLPSPPASLPRYLRWVSGLLDPA